MANPLTRAVKANPVRAVPLAFLAAIATGTVLLMLPGARAGTGGADLLTALFTATSSVCVTGLIVVDTPTYWSPFGQTVIMILFQAGGFGIMTAATLLTVLVTRRLGLSTRLIAQVETRRGPGDIRGVVLRIAATVLVVELTLAAILTERLRVGYDYPWDQALWHGTFQAISAFNNAGFSSFSDSLERFAADWWINLPIMTTIIISGLGFPVLFELLRRARQPRTWTVHTRLTVFGSAALLAIGMITTLALEWTNPATLGPLHSLDKTLAAAFQSVTTRTTGFNTIPTSELRTETWAVTDVLMFIGGGSAGTAGGIKVTTFFLLAFIIWSEIRGEPDVVIGRRRISSATIRQAVTVAALGITLVVLATIAILMITDETLDAVLFEAISAFATVGLSTGITAHLPAAAQLILIVLMFVGRVGTITVATALTLRTTRRHYRLPEERPIVG